MTVWNILNTIHLEMVKMVILCLLYFTTVKKFLENKISTTRINFMCSKGE